MAEQDGGRLAEEGTSCLSLEEAWARDHRHTHPRTRTRTLEAEGGHRAGVAAGAERAAGGGNAEVKEGECASALTEGRTTVAMGWQGDQRVQQAGIGAGAALSCQPSWRCGSE